MGIFHLPCNTSNASATGRIIEWQVSPDGGVIPFRALGLLEVLGIIGIIIPWLTGILPILTPVTAVCFAMVMTGAFWVHYKKHDYKVLPMIAVALLLSVAVAWFRFVEVG